VRSSKRKVAIAVLGGCVLVAVPGFLLFRAKDLAPGYVPLHTFLDDAAGLMDGTQVRLNGIPIGYLDAQKLTNSRDPKRKIEFDLKVKERYLREIPVDSVVGLASDNLLGDQFIGIRRGRSAQHVQAGAELGITQTQDMTRMMAQMSRQLDRLQAVVTRADKLMSNVGKGSGAIGKIVQNPQLQTGAGVSGELDQLMAAVQHGNGTVAKLFNEDPLDKQLEAPLKRLDAIMASAEATSARLKEFKDGLERATGEFHTLETEIDAGKGSFARLGQLQARFDELTFKIDGMMDKINSGQGAVGQLMVNPQLNEALAGTTREFQELAKGLRANPRKFIALRLF
jgi:phospholipid/cholesterol/gamma-HCH transport system substrate-binding protein